MFASVVDVILMPSSLNRDVRPAICAADQSSPLVCIAIAAVAPIAFTVSMSESVRSTSEAAAALSPCGPVALTADSS